MLRIRMQQQQQQHQFSDYDALSQPPFAVPNLGPNQVTVERMEDVQVQGFGSFSSPHSEHINLMLIPKLIKNWNPVYLDESISTFRLKDGPFRRHSGGNHDQTMPVLALETYKIVDAFKEAWSIIPPLLSKRKSLLDELLTVKGSINVFCRARPVSAGEGPSIFEFPNYFTLRIRTGEDDSANPKKDFEFDRVYEPDVTQEIIFADVMPFVRSALDGCDVTIFSFGQTGSGKTHTMLGSNKDRGLYDRCFKYLIYLSKSGANARTMSFEFSVSVCGMHHDQFGDLLSDDSIVEPSRVKVHKPCDFSRLLERTFDPTDDLKKCKFTHVFVTIHICSSNLITGEKISSKLSLAELAASEDPPVGDNRKFSDFLSGDVLGALPVHKVATFETSLFAKTLADTLGGKSKIVMIVNLCPEVASLSKTRFFLNLFSRGLENREAVKKRRGGDSQCNDLLEKYKMERNTNFELSVHIHQLQLKEQEQKLRVQECDSLIQDLQSELMILDRDYKMIFGEYIGLRKSYIYLKKRTQPMITDENTRLKEEFIYLKEKDQEQSLQIQQRDSLIQKLQDKLKSMESQQVLDSRSSSQSRCSVVELSKQDAVIEVPTPLLKRPSHVQALDHGSFSKNDDNDRGDIAPSPVAIVSERCATLISALSKFHQRKYDSEDFGASEADTLLTHVLWVILHPGASTKEEILAQMREAVLSFIFKMESKGLLDSKLVSQIMILYIKSLYATRSLELKSVEVPSVRRFLADSGLKLKWKPENKYRRLSVLRRMHSKDQEAGAPYLTFENLKGAYSFAIGNKDLAALFCHFESAELLDQILSCWKETSKCLSVMSNDDDVERNLQKVATRIMDDWQAGIGVAVPPSTNACCQLLAAYTKLVYNSQLQHLEDGAVKLASEGVNCLAQIPKLYSDLQSYNFQRRKLLEQMRTDVALMMLGDDVSSIRDPFTTVEDRLASLTLLDHIGKRVKNVLARVAEGEKKCLVGLHDELDDCRRLLSSLVDVDSQYAHDFILDVSDDVYSSGLELDH